MTCEFCAIHKLERVAKVLEMSSLTSYLNKWRDALIDIIAEKCSWCDINNCKDVFVEKEQS